MDNKLLFTNLRIINGRMLKIIIFMILMN